MRFRNRGFSLLEVLVAFVILALVLGTLMQIFAGGLRNIGLASEYQQAVLLGQSKLAAVGIELPLREGEFSGEFDPKFNPESNSTYRWKMRIRPSSSPDYQAAAPTNANGAATPVLSVALMEIELTVLWGDASSPRSISLHSVKLINRSTR